MVDGAGGGPELPGTPAGQTAGNRGSDPFEEWRRLRASQGNRASLIRLYEMVAEPRGLAAHELPQLVSCWRDDRMGYTEAKNDLIPDLVDRAERWAAARGWTA